MDVILLIEFIESVNKIAIVAFLVTLIIVGYEIYLLIKEKKKEEKPVIPEFRGDQSYGEVKVANVKKTEEKTIYRKSNTKLIVILIVLMVFFAAIYIGGLLIKGEGLDNELSSRRARVIRSAGIKLYSKDWVEISEAEYTNFKGKNIFIGVKDITGSDIDKARIRVNSDQWELEDETSKLNSDHNVYYISYKVATDAAQLKIEAQLHRKEHGWLTEQDI